MTNYYIYLDETGTPDLNDSTNPYFGIGSATFTEKTHNNALNTINELRLQLGRKGVQIPNGFHAKDDSKNTRTEFLKALNNAQPTLRATIFKKQSAYPELKERGPLWFYKYAIWRHLDHILNRGTEPNDQISIVAARIDLKAKREQLNHALEDVNNQLKRNTTLHIWSSASSYGLQIADYGLWAMQRQILKGDLTSEQLYAVQANWQRIDDQYPWGK